MQVTYCYFSNAQQKKAIDELLEKWQEDLPPWLQTLRVHMVNFDQNVGVCVMTLASEG